jgi:arginyl-tRNA synthetase
MQISSILKDSPINIANEIAKNIKIKSIKKFEIANPGFINFFLNENAFFNIIEKIINEKENYGKNNQGKYINVEYVSANPTGFLHIGHARGAVLGSSLVNILKFAGNKVDSEYYLNDTGNQVDILAKTVQFRYLQELGQNVKIPENIYKGKDIIYVAKKFVKKYKDSLKNEKFNRFKLESKNILLKKIKKDLKKYKVYFDIFTTEQEILDKNLIKPTIKKLEKNIYINKGAS